MNPRIEETIKKQLTDRKNAHFMLVDGMSKLMTHGATWLKSSYFHVSGLNWNFSVHLPKKDGTRDNLGLGLKLRDAKPLPSNWEVKCSYKLSVVSQTKDVADICKPYVGRYNEKSTKIWSLNFISPALMERKLEMYPKGNKAGKENFLSLYLNASDYVTGPKEDTFAVFKLRVLDQLHGKHHEKIRSDFWFTYNESGGFPKFLPLDELHDPRRGLLLNDQIYIGVEFLLVSTTEYL